MQFSPTSCYLIPLWSKYSPQISEYGNERKDMGKFEALFPHLPGTTEGNHEKLHSGCFIPSIMYVKTTDNKGPHSI
jgi:hypothetical protein